MNGFAKESFSTLTGNTPWQTDLHLKQEDGWLFLKTLVKERRLDPIHYYLTEQLLQGHPKPTEEIAACLCYASLAAQQGHGCIYVEGGSHLIPDPFTLIQQTLLKNEENSIPLQPQIKHWELLILKGIYSIPLVNTDLRQYERLFFCIEKGNKRALLFQNQWLHQAECWQRWRVISARTPSIAVNEQSLQGFLQPLLKERLLLPEQAQAIITACRHSISLLSGGPGTGKSYTAGWMIKALIENIPAEERESFEIAFAAPTGKAAANLGHYLNKVMGSHPIASAKTLHTLLGIGKSKQAHTLSADLVIVDECSMVDTGQMLALLKAIKPGARLVLIGDKEQLPPVESGAFFADLMKTTTAEDGLSNKVELKTCLRTDCPSILKLASAISQGEASEALALLREERETLRWTQPEEDIKKVQAQLLQRFKELGFFHSQQGQDHARLLKEFSRFRLLSPMRQGPLGVDTLNDLIFHQFYRQCRDNDKMMIPIMITANDYRLNLFNGEVGIVIKSLDSNQGSPLNFQKGDIALFSSGEGKVRPLPALMLPKAELAYCLSIHKSQGSEFDHILLVLPEEAKVFGRELLYTAVTRGKQRVEIIGSMATLKSMIFHSAERVSIDFLYNVVR